MITPANLATELNVHIGKQTGAPNILFWACSYAGVNLNVKIVEGIVAFNFTDGTTGLYPFYYNHNVAGGLIFGSKLIGDGDIGSYNEQGTVANASEATVFILGVFSRT